MTGALLTAYLAVSVYDPHVGAVVELANYPGACKVPVPVGTLPGRILL